MKFLNNKAGVTVLEGVIALGLLAVVTAGAFGVLVSASRKSSQPEMREEMTFAIENAKNALRKYTGDEEPGTGLCDEDTSAPLAVGSHDIKCRLPLMCDKSHPGSHFTYTVVSLPALDDTKVRLISEDRDFSPQTSQIEFNISCNGYEL